VVRNPQLHDGKLFVVNIKSSGEYAVLNAVDEELLGKRISEGAYSMFIDPRYFDGERVDEQGLRDLIRSNSIVNLVGNRAVQVAIDMGFGSSDAVRVIGGIKFLIIYKFVGNY